MRYLATAVAASAVAGLAYYKRKSLASLLSPTTHAALTPENARAALDETRGNIRQAARKLGCSAVTMHEILKAHPSLRAHALHLRKLDSATGMGRPPRVLHGRDEDAGES